MRQSKWNATAAYALLQIVCWGFFASTLCFSSNVLYAFGFTDSRISMFMGVCTAASVGLQLVLAETVARSGKIRLWALLAVLGLGLVLCNGLVLGEGFPVAAFGAACVILQVLPSFINGIGMDAIKRGSPTNYSVARGLGSLGYSGYAFLTGALVRDRGAGMVAVVGIVGAVLLILAVFWYHRAGERGLPEPETHAAEKKQRSGFLRSYPRFALFLAGAMLVQYGHNLQSNFLYQIMLVKGGTAAEQGLAASVGAMVELPIMFLFPLLMRYLRCDKWVRLSALFMAVRAAGILASHTPYGIYAAQATQMLGYGLFCISTVNYAELVVGRGESVRAQTYLGATSSVSILFSMSSGGFLVEHLGAQTMVLAALMFSLAGGLMIALTAQRTRQ